MVMPAGSAPVTDQVIVPCPPLCENVSLNATPEVPVLLAGFVTVIVGQVMTRLYVALVPVQLLPSVTVTLIGKGPPCVGVPESVPLAARVRPFGSVLDVVNVAPPTAPLCVKVCEKAVPTVPVDVAGFVTVIVGQPMIRLYVALVPVQLCESVTVTTIGNVPVCVGVPESTPFAARARPAGSVLAVVNVAAPMAPVCVNVWLNG